MAPQPGHHWGRTWDVGARSRAKVLPDASAFGCPASAEPKAVNRGAIPHDAAGRTSPDPNQATP